MKKIYLLITLLLAFLVTGAHAQSQQEVISAVHEAIGRGEVIFGGIMLAQKCNNLEESEYVDFEGKARAIIGLIKKIVGQEKVNVMVQRARIGIKAKPYSECGDEMNTFVNSSKLFVEKTYAILNTKKH